MAGKDDVQPIMRVRGGTPVLLLAKEWRSGRWKVRANEGDRFAGCPRRLAKRQESNGHREMSRLAAREKL
jgi:hypothetical protein